MKAKLLVLGALMLGILVPVAQAKEKKKPPRGMIESMQSLPCGVKQKGLNGLGAVWGSIGVTSVSSNEKLCPQYLFRTDELEYHIRPTDSKHPVILPIGHEAEFKIKKDRMLLKVPDGDKKTRTYQVVAMEPTKSANGEESSAYRSRDNSPPVSRPATTPPLETTPTNGLPQQAINQNPPAQTPPPPHN